MHATDLVRSLILTHFGEGASHPAQVEERSRSVDRGSAGYWLYFQDYFADVCVWDHAFCLDILVFCESGSEDIVWSEAGSCGDEAALRARFLRFVDWMSEHDK